MAFNLESITKGKRERAPRIVLLGVEKIGKTTFACGAPNPVLLPIKGEEGADAMDVAKFPTVKNYSEVIDAISTLYSEEHDYKTIIIDSASTLEPIIHEATCKRTGANSIEQVHGGFGKGYTETLSEWRNITDGLDALREHRDMTSIIIGHVAVKPFNDPTADSYDSYVFDVHKGAAAALMRWSDAILFANRRVAVKKEDAGFNKTKARATGGDDRYLYTQKRAAHPGGGRGIYGQLPYELPLSWQAYSDAIAAASKTD